MGNLCDAILYKLAVAVSTITAAIQEVDANKSDKINSVSSTIPTSDWVADSTYSDFPYRYDLKITDVTANDFVTIIVSPSSFSVAEACNLCPTNESAAGIVKIWAKTVPTASISIEYRVEEGVATE